MRIPDGQRARGERKKVDIILSGFSFRLRTILRPGAVPTQWSVAMKSIPLFLFASIALTAPAISHAQVAGSTLIGVSVTEMRDVTTGWSAKRQILGQPIFNDKNERVGSIDDIIVAPDKAVSYAVINAGGFTGLTKHDVAVPISQLKLVDNKLVLAGATKEALKASPAFEYAR